MSPDEKPISDLSALEAALASLTRRADGIDRDRVMFLVGQASAAPPPTARLRTWQAAFAAMSALAASLLVALVVQPGPQVVERFIPVGLKSDSPISVDKDHQPAMLPDGATVAQVAAGNDGLESSPGWPWEPFVLERSDRRGRYVAHAGWSRAAYARWLEPGPDNGIGATREPAGASSHVPTIEPPPASYRDLLDRLLKESGAENTERPT
jgi:hypothetical protein